MAYTPRKPNQSNNYFERNIRESGDEFHLKKTPRDMQYDASNIFREIARGKIDVVKYSNYLLDPQFLESCIFTASQKYNHFYISFQGMTYYINWLRASNTQVDTFVLEVEESHRKSAEAFWTVLTMLNILKTTGNANAVIGYVPLLSSYKNYL